MSSKSPRALGCTPLSTIRSGLFWGSAWEARRYSQSSLQESAHLFFQDFDGVLRDYVHCVVDLDLQNQVRPALQIESEVDVIGQPIQQPLAGKTARLPEDPEEEKQQRAHDEDELPAKILVHSQKLIVKSS